MESIKIFSWNIMAQRFIIRDIESGDYDYIKDKTILDWKTRLSQIISWISNADPDIICLQEIELADFTLDFKDLLINYNYQAHCISKKRTSPIGNVTLYRNKYECVPGPEKSSAVLCKFEIDDFSFVLVNVHLKAGYLSGEKNRECQLHSIIKSLDKDVNVLIIGDFNDDLLEEHYEVKRLLYPIITNNNYKIADGQLTCCTKKINFWSFDRIVYKNMEIKVYSCEKIKTIPNKYDDNYYPTDHLPIQCNLIIKKIDS